MANGHGGKRPGAGRKPGIPNKNQETVVAFARSIVEDVTYQANLLQRAQAGELAPPVETMLYHYAYGKPMDPQPHDDRAFLQALLAVVVKHVGSTEGRQEIRQIVETYARADGLRAVA